MLREIWQFSPKFVGITFKLFTFGFRIIGRVTLLVRSHLGVLSVTLWSPPLSSAAKFVGPLIESWIHFSRAKKGRKKLAFDPIILV